MWFLSKTLGFPLKNNKKDSDDIRTYHVLLIYIDFVLENSTSVY